MGTRRTLGRAAAVVALGLVAAACQPGTPETGFGDGGTVVLDAPAGSVSAAPAGDGGIVVVRGGGELVRLAPDGAVVAGWGGATPVPCAERDEVDRDARGRYLLACTSTAADGARVSDVVRYTRAGRLDRAFGTGGVVRLAGPLEGADAVPLPGGRVLALGGRPDPAAGRPGVLVTTVLDRRGRVVTSGERELPELDVVPPELRGGVVVTVVAEPTAEGAVAAIHAETVLNITDVVRPTDPFLLLFGTDGAEVARLEGPAYPGGVGASRVTALAPLPGGRIAVLEDWWRLRNDPRPTADTAWPVRIYAPDGTQLQRFDPAVPGVPEDPTPRPVTGRTLLATAGGRHLLVGGTYDSATSTSGGVLRYDTATWALDPAFGTAGVADVGERVAVADLDPRGNGPGQVDATARRIPSEADPGDPAVVVRLWNQPPATD